MKKDLISKIKKDTILSINEKEYIVKSKVCYYTEKDLENLYYKIKFHNNMILIITEDLSDISIGMEINIEDEVDFPSPNQIIYNGKKYFLENADYQFVKNVEFGEFFEYEPECRFMDYSSEDGNSTLSIGVDTYNNKRDDVYAEKVLLEEIGIK